MGQQHRQPFISVGRAQISAHVLFVLLELCSFHAPPPEKQCGDIGAAACDYATSLVLSDARTLVVTCGAFRFLPPPRLLWPLYGMLPKRSLFAGALSVYCPGSKPPLRSNEMISRDTFSGRR